MTNFESWLKEKYPDIRLSVHQTNMVNHIYRSPLGCGKTFLIGLLHEYDNVHPALHYVKRKPDEWQDRLDLGIKEESLRRTLIEGSWDTTTGEVMLENR